MRNQAKKAFSLLLALVMCLSVMSVGAFAESLPTSDGAVAQIGSTYYATLEDAISAAQSEDIIEILDGRWGADAIGTRDGAKWRDPSNLLRAKSLTIQPAEGATVTFTDNVYLGYDDCTTANATMTVTGLNFEDATLTLDNYVQATVEYCSFVGSGANAALYISDSCAKNHLSDDVYPVDQVTVSNCTFDGTKSGASGIRLRATGNVTLTENTVANAAHNGILFETHAYIDDQTTKDISITNNTITEWNAGNVAEGGRAMRLAFSGEDKEAGVKSGPLSDNSTLTIEDNYFTKATLGLDSPDFVKITDTSNAAVSLEHNSWSNNKLADVNGKSAFYTVNGDIITINTVICDAASNAVAEVNGTEYETLKDAVDAASANDTITLLDDVTYDEKHTVDVWGDKAFNLDLGGYTLETRSGIGKDLSNMGYTASAICYACDDGSVKVSNGTIKTAYGAGIYVAGHEVTLSGLTIQANLTGVQSTLEYSSAVRLTSGATVTIESGSYSGKNAIAVSNSGGNVTVNDGTFTGDIFFNTSTNTDVTKSITINGGTFTGDFVNTDKGTLTINGGKFSTNPSNYVDPNTYSVTKVGAYWVVAKQSGLQVSAELGGTIKLKIEPINNSQVTVEDIYNNEDHEVDIQKGTDKSEARVPIKDTNASIRVEDSDGGVNYITVAEYLRQIYEDTTATYSNVAKAAAKATFNLGNAAEKYFAPGNTGYVYTSADDDQLASDISDVMTSGTGLYDTVNVSNAQATVNGLPDGLSYIGISLLLKQDTILRLNFQAVDSRSYALEEVHVQIGNRNYDVSFKSRGGGYWYAEIDTGIAADHLADQYTVTSDSGFTVDVSPLSYAKIVLDPAHTNNYSSALTNLAKALYVYYDTAAAAAAAVEP